MKLNNILLALAFMTFGFTSCKTLQVEKPKETYLPSNLAPAISELPLKLEIDIAKLEAAINKKMNGLLFEGSKISDKDLSIKVWKAQDFSFKINNNVIEYRIPLKLWSSFAWKVQKFGITVGDQYEANGSIALMYKTTIGIDKNWKLVAKTASAGYQWIETPKLNVVGVNVPVTPIADIALDRCEKIISTQIDKALTEAVDMKKYLSMTWNELQTPRQVNAENDLWVRITPKDMSMSPFVTVGNKLNVAIALAAQIESFMGVQPPANTKLPLPTFKVNPKPAQQFNLNIATDVTFDKMLEIAKKQLLNKTFGEGKKSIQIQDLSIFGSEGKAVFVADVTGAIKGRIYFNGEMSYNKETKSVEVLNPQFDIKTKDALLKSASWLLKGVILNKMMPYLTYPVTSDLEKLKMDANKLLSNYSVYDGVSLQGKLSEVNVLSLSLIPGALRIETNIKGNVALMVNDLKF